MKRLDGFVLCEPETVILFRGGSINLFGLLPIFARLGLCKGSLAALGTMMVKTVQLDGEFGRTQWHGHINLVRRPGPFI